MKRVFIVVFLGLAFAGPLAAEDISVWILVSGSERYNDKIAKEMMSEISLHPSIVQAVDWTTAIRKGEHVQTAPQNCEAYNEEIAKLMMSEISLHPSIVQALDWTTATRQGEHVETAPQFSFEVTVVDLDVELLAYYVVSLEYGSGNADDAYHELVDAFHYPRSGWVTGLYDNIAGIARSLVNEFLEYVVPASLEDARGKQERASTATGRR